MSTFALDRPEEGDAVLATDVQTNMANARSAVNALEEDAIAPRALNQNHLPSIVIAQGSDGWSASPGALYNIWRTYPGWDTVAGWQRIKWDTAEVSPGTATTAADSLATEVSTYSGVALSATVDLADTALAGIVVEAGINLREMYDSVSGVGNDAYTFVFAIQVHTTDGTWHHIARSERFICASSERYAINVATLVLSSDVSSTKTVDGVRLVASIVTLYNSPAPGSNADEGRIESGNLLAWAVQSGGV
jgi:hypothetical protein